MKKRTVLIVSIILLGIAAKAFPYNLPSNEPQRPRTPSYFPGDGACVVFHPGECFAFLWPEGWANRSDLSFVLVAVNEGQRAEDAVLNNTPILQKEGIQTYYLLYPFDAPPLEYGNYAWQIKNSNDNVLLTTGFQIGSENLSGYEVSVPERVWMYTKEKTDGGCHIAFDRSLCIHVYEPYSVVDTQKLRFCVYDSRWQILLKTSESGVITVPTQSLSTSPYIKTGENWLTISLDNTFVYYDYYYLEVWDGKGEKSYLRFKCAPSNPRIIPTSD